MSFFQAQGPPAPMMPRAPGLHALSVPPSPELFSLRNGKANNSRSLGRNRGCDLCDACVFYRINLVNNEARFVVN